METKKNPPVDRGKLMDSLGRCVDSECDGCPYMCDCHQQIVDSIAYICYLERQLGVTGV